MNHAVSAERGVGRPPAGDATRLGAAERIAFFLLLVVVGVRPLVGETYESARVAATRILNLPDGRGPVFPLTLGALILLAGLLMAIGRSRAGASVAARASGLAAGMLFLAVGMAVSLLAASNRRLALNVSSDWLLAALLCWLLVQLLRHPWQFRLLGCVLLASAAAFAFQCTLQRFDEYAETIADYEKHKDEFRAAFGDAHAQLYERRLYAREATGFFSLSNVAGGYLLLSAWIAAAIAASRWAGCRDRFRRAAGLFAAILAMLLFGCIFCTGSRGPVVAGLLAAVLAMLWGLLGCRRWPRWIRWLLGWGVALAGGTAVVLAASRASPFSSMGFRWAYWQNTSHLLREYFWTGVGGGNFGRFYLQYKPITSPEEVSDPHNFVVAVAAQWGIIGLAGLLAMALGVALRLVRPGGRAHTETGEPASSAPAIDCAGASRSPIPWLATLALAIFALRVWSLWGHQTAYVVYATAVPALVWMLTATALTIEGNRFAFWLNEPPATATGFILFSGLLAFLLHAMIDVTMSYPATITLAFTVLAMALATKQPAEASVGSEPRPRSAAPWPVLAVCLAASLVAYGAWLWRPAAAAQENLEAARRLAQRETDVNPVRSAALARYHAAIAADPLDPTAPLEAAEWLLGTAVRSASASRSVWHDQLLSEAIRLLHLAKARDPKEIGVYRVQSFAFLLRAQSTGSVVDIRAALGAAQAALNLYPQSPADMETYGDTLLALHESLCRLEPAAEPVEGADEVRDGAIAAYERALALDAARPGEKELRRWLPAKRAELEARIRDLRKPASRPASHPTSTMHAPAEAPPTVLPSSDPSGSADK